MIWTCKLYHSYYTCLEIRYLNEGKYTNSSLIEIFSTLNAPDLIIYSVCDVSRTDKIFALEF